MNRNTVTVWAAAVASCLVLGACGGGESSGVTGATSGPRYPAVEGNWRGEWAAGSSRPATVTLRLTQSGSQVRGTLTVGRDENEITGTIDEFGVLEFTGRDTDQSNGCSAYYSDRPHLELAEQNTELSGPVRRALSNCVSNRVLNQGGVMELDKVL
jgi:hypothetical protein